MSARSEAPIAKQLKLPPIKYNPGNVPLEAWKRHLDERAKAETRQRKEDAILVAITLYDSFV